MRNHYSKYKMGDLVYISDTGEYKKLGIVYDISHQHIKIFWFEDQISGLFAKNSPYIRSFYNMQRKHV